MPETSEIDQVIAKSRCLPALVETTKLVLKGTEWTKTERNWFDACVQLSNGYSVVIWGFGGDQFGYRTGVYCDID